MRRYLRKPNSMSFLSLHMQGPSGDSVRSWFYITQTKDSCLQVGYKAISSARAPSCLVCRECTWYTFRIRVITPGMLSRIGQFEDLASPIIIRNSRSFKYEAIKLIMAPLYSKILSLNTRSSCHCVSKALARCKNTAHVVSLLLSSSLMVFVRRNSLVPMPALNPNCSQEIGATSTISSGRRVTITFYRLERRLILIFGMN